MSSIASDNTAAKRANDFPKLSFQARFITPTTVLIIEDDSYMEQPNIYIKVYSDLLLITDTGTSSPRDRHSSTCITLRTFLETVPITHPTTAKCEPLNPSGHKRYLILCTHAHYDHILGIPPFLDATPPPFIVASGNDPTFVTTDLPTHSLCKYLGIPTPVYTINHWVRHLEDLGHPSFLQTAVVEGRELVATKPSSLGVRCLHIPGHTPDSLAWYDIDEHRLYIGDMFYAACPVPGKDSEDVSPLPEQEAAIIFPAEGDWSAYMSSLDLIISFAAHENTKLKSRSQQTAPLLEAPAPQRVKVGCGHVTFDGDAESMAREVKELFERILGGKVPVVRSFVKRGLRFDVWRERKESSYIVEAPRRLCDEARKGGNWDSVNINLLVCPIPGEW